MAQNSRIEWTNHTFNPWWGCTKVSPACDHCYAETWAKRMGHAVWGHRSERRFLSEAYWKQPHQWNRVAKQERSRARVFCASMADVFEWRKELSPPRQRLWKLIDETPFLDWLLLTKRPHLVTRLVPWTTKWPHNVWIGVTAENQRWADKRLPHLAALAAKTKFLSCEPLLGPIDLTDWLKRGSIDWIITGGESGPGARPSDPEWFRSVRNQCQAHGVAFHFKQWGDWAPKTSWCSPRPRAEFDGHSVALARFGKKVSGRLLDGRTWDELPGIPKYCST